MSGFKRTSSRVDGDWIELQDALVGVVELVGHAFDKDERVNSDCLDAQTRDGGEGVQDGFGRQR